MKTAVYTFGVVCCLLLGSGQAGAVLFIDPNGVIQFDTPYTPPRIETKKQAPRRERQGIKKKVSKKNFEDLILKAQREYGVPKALIKAVIQAESNFDPWAVSPKGATGLMQIMPGNFRTLEISNPFDPGENIMGGTKYLRELLDRYDRQLNLALAAYNAGPDAVDQYGQVPPFTETRQYIRKVVYLYKQYTAIK